MPERPPFHVWGTQPLPLSSSPQGPQGGGAAQRQKYARYPPKKQQELVPVKNSTAIKGFKTYDIIFWSYFIADLRQVLGYLLEEV